MCVEQPLQGICTFNDITALIRIACDGNKARSDIWNIDLDITVLDVINIRIVYVSIRD